MVLLLVVHLLLCLQKHTATAVLAGLVEICHGCILVQLHRILAAKYVPHFTMFSFDPNMTSHLTAFSSSSVIQDSRVVDLPEGLIRRSSLRHVAIQGRSGRTDGFPLTLSPASSTGCADNVTYCTELSPYRVHRRHQMTGGDMERSCSKLYLLKPEAA